MTDIATRLRQGVDPDDISETERAMDTAAAEIEELEAQRERLLAVLNQGMTLIDHLMGELAQQGGRKPPFAVALAKQQFHDAMRALLTAPASQGSASDLSPDASAGDPA